MIDAENIRRGVASALDLPAQQVVVMERDHGAEIAIGVVVPTRSGTLRHAVPWNIRAIERLREWLAEHGL